MAEKKLPEINIAEGQIVLEAAQLVQARAEKAILETKEKNLKASIEVQAAAVRDEKLDKGEIVGLIRLTTEQMPVQVQFKIDSKKAALDLSDEETLDDLFKGARPLLFGKDKIVTEITGPEELLAAMKASGRNPWDFLKLTVKENMDEVVASYPNVISNETFMPKTGFLATLHDIWRTLSEEAIEYVKTYVKEVIKPSVVVGSQGKGK
jgi:hypothetical protein